MDVSASEILSAFQPQGLLVEVLGDSQAKATRVAPVEDCQPGDLVFVDKKEFVPFVTQRHPSVIVTSEALKGLLSEFDGQAILVASDVPLAHALLKQRYGARDYSATGWSGVHPSAVVHETAVLGEGTVVEPRVVIGPGVRTGKNCRIMAGSVIENDARLGDDVMIHPCAVIGFGCELGNQVQIGSSTVIGTEGYGYAQDAQRKSHAIPQTGKVIIGDRVRIGGGCCVDRGSYRATRIGAGTKIDNLSHIAHNVEIGEDCLLTAMFCVAGSTKLGNRVIASGQSGALDHLTIADDVVLLHKAGVAKDILEPGMYAGIPTQPLSDYMKNTAVFRNAADLRKTVKDLERQVAKLLSEKN